MRAVFTGITGVGKEDIARKLACEAAKQHGFIANLTDSRTKKFIQVQSVEHEIKNALGDLRPFLDQILPQERSRRWKEAMTRIMERVANAEHTLLCLHNVFYRRSNFYTCTDWDLLRAYQPTIFITLTNDLYDVWETINARERQFSTNSYFHLADILAWRSAETSATESIAQNLYAPRRDLMPDSVQTEFGSAIPHFLFAVKHPLQTLYQLLFRRDILRVYASYPITKTRDDPNGRKEIDGYRQQLFDSGFLTVFDPLTIDEFRFAESLQPGEPGLRARWPLALGPPMVAEVSLGMNPFEGYNKLQFESLRLSVARHVQSRDYKLVSQSQCLAAYRPFYGGPLGSNAPPSDKPSGGVDKELMYALAESKRTYAFHPYQDHHKEGEVFSSVDFAVHPPEFAGLLEELKKAQSAWAKSLDEHEEGKTWESKKEKTNESR